VWGRRRRVCPGLVRLVRLGVWCGVVYLVVEACTRAGEYLGQAPLQGLHVAVQQGLVLRHL